MYMHTPQVMSSFFVSALQGADHRLTPSSTCPSSLLQDT